MILKKKTGYQVDESGNVINKEERVVEESTSQSHLYTRPQHRHDYKR